MGKLRFTAFDFEKLFHRLLLNEQDWKDYRDMKNSIDTAVKDREIEIARTLKQKGIDWEAIQGATGLSKEIIESL
jgi:hypothetical protein